MSRKLELVNVWAQIITGIAVIAGLGLVIWELQLTRQANYDMYALIAISDDSADTSAIYGEQAGEVVARACFEPGSLSNAELFILGKYFENRLNRVYQTLWQSNYLGNDDFQRVAPYWLRAILALPQGELYLQQWIAAEGDNEFEIKQLINDMITAGNYPNCRDLIEGLRLQS